MLGYASLGVLGAYGGMMAETATNPEVAALEKAWWAAWWQADYSWDGLAQKRDAGDGKSLQDYWSSEQAFLIAEPGTGRRWTRLHCPFIFADGTPSPKAGWASELWDEVASVAQAAPDRLSGVVLDTLKLDRHTSVCAKQAYIRNMVNVQGELRANFRLAWLTSALFNGAILTQADFSQTTFRYRSGFMGTAFKQGARFSRAHFLGTASFDGARFEGAVAQDEHAFFDGAYFAGPVEFPEVEFEAEAVFNGARLAGRANFFGARFEDRALFDDIACLENIHFYKAAFVRRLTINDAKFYGKANFEGVTDGDPISLSSQPIRLQVKDGSLSGELSPGTGPTPRSYLALPKILAKDAVFYNDANFSNRDLLSPSTFEGAHFHHLARFHGSDIHANVSFHNAIFRKALGHSPQVLPPFPESLLKLRFAAVGGSDYRAWKKDYLKGRAAALKESFGRNSYFDALEASYRTLKQLMEDRRDRIREGDFFTLELLARRRRSDVPWWERGFSWLYSTVANYGNSIFGPLFWLLALLAASAAGYYQAAECVVYHSAALNHDHLLSAFSFAWHNAFAPFSALDASKSGGGDAWLNDVLFGAHTGFAMVLKVAATVQSLLTLLLAFLFALAARRRFQIN